MIVTTGSGGSDCGSAGRGLGSVKAAHTRPSDMSAMFCTVRSSGGETKPRENE